MSLAFDEASYRNSWNTPYTAAVDDALRAKWHSGKSGSNIARELSREFGVFITSQSVSARSRRLNLPERKSPWTVESKARLKELWGKGTQYRELASIINAEFGTQFTRNAIAGCLDRLDVAIRRTPLTAADIVARRERERDNARRYRERHREEINARQAEYSRRATRASYKPRLLDIEIPVQQRKAFMQLEAHHCRYPVGEPGEPDFFFCGGEAVEGHSYCDGHCRLSYNLQAKFSTYGREAA